METIDWEPKFNPGDLILCKDEQDAINAMVALSNAGVETDFVHKDGRIYLGVLASDE